MRAFLVRLTLAAMAVATAANAQISAEERDIDGVPLPQLSAVKDDSFWTGVWAGAWGGSLKHLLAVEVVDGGAAEVVYAWGDAPAFGFSRGWARLQARIEDQRLIVEGPGFTADYRPREGRLDATYAAGPARAAALMTKVNPAAIAAGAPDWGFGRSEILETTLVEDGAPVRLEVVFYGPEGGEKDDAPLAVVSHGSTGRGDAPAFFQETWRAPALAAFLTARGWRVAFPQRRGRGRSDGLYDEGFLEDRSAYSCDAAVALGGADRAMEDLDAAIQAIRGRLGGDARPVLLIGQSRGGVLSAAFAGRRPETVAGVVNFVGGWLGEGCETAAEVNDALFAEAAAFRRRTLWVYGRPDPYYGEAHVRARLAAFRAAGGEAEFLILDPPGGAGHDAISFPSLWTDALAQHLMRIERLAQDDERGAE